MWLKFDTFCTVHFMNFQRIELYIFDDFLTTLVNNRPFFDQFVQKSTLFCTVHFVIFQRIELYIFDDFLTTLVFRQNAKKMPKKSLSIFCLGCHCFHKGLGSPPDVE